MSPEMACRRCCWRRTLPDLAQPQTSAACRWRGSMRTGRKRTLASAGKRTVGLVAGRGSEETTRACPEGLQDLGCLHE